MWEVWHQAVISIRPGPSGFFTEYKRQWLLEVLGTSLNKCALAAGIMPRLGGNRNWNSYVIRQLLHGVLCLGLLIAEVGSQEPATDRTEGSIRRWIAALGSERFEERTLAMERLVDLGAVVVSPLEEAIPVSADLEVQIRGLHVLAKLAVTEDVPVESEVLQALNRLAGQENTPLGRRAKKILSEVQQLRATRAVVRLRRLGAIVDLAQLLEWARGRPMMWVGRMMIPGDEAPQLNNAEWLVLEAARWQGQPEDLEVLRDLPDIHTVILDGGLFAKGYLPHIARLPRLRKLLFRNFHPADSDVTAFKGHNALDTWSLWYTGTADVALSVACDIPHLTLVTLLGTPVSADAEQHFRKTRPEVLLDHKPGGAFLGISPSTMPEHLLAGVAVESVRPGGAAEIAGLAAGDVIHKFDGQAVQGFDKLKELIAAHRPGDTVPIEIERGDQRLTKQVKLTSWEAQDWFLMISSIQR